MLVQWELRKILCTFCPPKLQYRTLCGLASGQCVLGCFLEVAHLSSVPRPLVLRAQRACACALCLTRSKGKVKRGRKCEKGEGRMERRGVWGVAEL